MKKNVFFLAALLTASAVVMTGCSSEMAETQTVAQQNDGKVISYSVSIPATKASDDVTRALSTSGTDDATLSAAWNNENVYVYSGNTKVGTLNPNSTGASTQLVGTLSKNGGFAENEELTLYYLKDKGQQDVYTGQVGTIADISSNFDYAQATITVQVIAPTDIFGGENILKTSSATFSHRQAVAKLSLTFKGTALNATALQIAANGLTGGPLTITPAAATSTIFGALHNSNAEGQNYTFTATAGGQQYSISASNLILADGSYYRQTLPLKKSANHLTIEAIADQTYANADITPEPVVKDGDYTLVKGTDYESTITYSNNRNVGTATVTITAKGGNYDGTKSTTFQIVKATPVINIADNVANTIIMKDATKSIGATVTLGGTIDNTKYTSSDTNVATVSNAGVITAVGAGKATITVKSTETANLEVATKTFDVYVRENIGGDINQPGNGTSW